MAAPEFFYLDTVPINETLLEPNKALEQALDYRRQLNLAINCVQAENSLTNQYKLFRSVLENDSELTVLDLNKVLESYLNLLIAIPSISTLDKGALSSHYQRRKLLVADQFLVPDSTYLEELLFTSVRTWGTSYGSLGYTLHLDQNREHYLHPSQIVDLAVNGVFKRMQHNESLGKFGSDFLETYTDDDPYTDLAIYKTQVQLFELPEIRDAITQLDFYEQWLPQVINWYLKPYREGEPLRQVPEKGTPQDEAIKTLIAVATTCLDMGFDDGSFSNLIYNFAHQSFPPALFGLLDDILLVRKRTGFNPLASTFTDEEKLLTPFINVITINNQLGNLRAVSYSLLSDLCAPGGYNLLLVSIAATLINRAYILTHPTNTSFTDVTIFPLKTGLTPLLEFIGRIFRLIYLAGYTLLKSNLPHLQIAGSNLVEFSALDTSGNITAINDLTQ